MKNKKDYRKIKLKKELEKISQRFINQKNTKELG